MNRPKTNFFLIMFLTTASITNSYAQSLQTQDWANWNAASPPVLPAENWMQYETPEEAGWSSEKLSEAQKLSGMNGSAAVMVIYNGAIVAQWGQTDRRFKIHSIAKSILSALYGIAVEEGDVDINETIGSIGIDDISPLTQVEKSAKVSDLLKARSGVYLPAAGESYGMRANRPKRGSHEPGTYWSYNGWDFDVLGTIYNKKTSGDLFKAFDKHFAFPLQMQDFELRHTNYIFRPEESRHPWFSFRMSARDLARFGLLFLNEGRWKEKQIVPSEWVRESTKSYSSRGGVSYGYMWWTNWERSSLGKLDAYMALGWGGHALYVIPGAKLVFVYRTNTYEGKASYIEAPLILIDVLEARVGPPSPSPKLITLSNTQATVPRQTLSKTQTSGLTGKYIGHDEVITIRELDDRLEITNPLTGSFYLFPRTATEFEIEDEERRLVFELDATGRSTAIRIWIRADESYQFRRVGNDSDVK